MAIAPDGKIPHHGLHCAERVVGCGEDRQSKDEKSTATS